MWFMLRFLGLVCAVLSEFEKIMKSIEGWTVKNWGFAEDFQWLGFKGFDSIFECID